MNINHSVTAAPFRTPNNPSHNSAPDAGGQSPRADTSAPERTADRHTLSTLAETQSADKGRNDGKTRAQEARVESRDTRDRNAVQTNSSQAITSFEQVAQTPRSGNFHTVA